MSYTAGPKVGTASTGPSSASASITWKTLVRGTPDSWASCALLAEPTLRRTSKSRAA